MNTLMNRLYVGITLPHSLIVALGALLLVASSATTGAAKEISHDVAKRICKGHAPAGTGCAYCKGLYCTYVACDDKACDIVVVNAPSKKDAAPANSSKVPSVESTTVAPAQ
ncbi:hypothetical protein [Aestuariivirga sp.]|uniref:hypothetical protein n=1 Tax=Aestuariivirga sp. TaxID=2650926 RepID=UPI00391AF42B